MKEELSPGHQRKINEMFRCKGGEEGAEEGGRFAAKASPAFQAAAQAEWQQRAGIIRRQSEAVQAARNRKRQAREEKEKRERKEGERERGKEGEGNGCTSAPSPACEGNEGRREEGKEGKEGGGGEEAARAAQRVAAVKSKLDHDSRVQEEMQVLRPEVRRAIEAKTRGSNHFPTVVTRLGIAKLGWGASREAAAKVYKRCLLTFHPDRCKRDASLRDRLKHEEIFKLLAATYKDFLSNLLR